ncbi:hypothetical protein N6H18_00215 [Reichenbachiella agarivorans]|uniref:Uncharacterized protein n=1 Tax=Reichenbachiella agarivorans TaxID=2979464 RepID=A0ABY6CSP4_9BACT|nr:hypothetical protein [Reichenbachiella agarivorans]UXP32398.1 hypothetical protein N6H18_00215 [Reichenbachiella agarivorans]
MKFIKAALVVFTILTLTSACSQEEDLILPSIDTKEATGGASGDRDNGKTPPVPSN